MIRRPPRSTRTDTPFPTRRSSDLLLPIGEPRLVSGKLELYGQNLQIVHPDNVLAPDQADELPEREAVYPLSEGLTNKRLAALAVQALARIPTLPEWVEPRVLSRARKSVVSGKSVSVRVYHGGRRTTKNTNTTTTNN